MTLDGPQVRILRRGLDHVDAALLIAEVQAEYTEIYGTPDEAPIDVDEFAGEAGVFYVGYVGEVPVATGAWRHIDVPTALESLGATCAAEVKRMYVRREWRRQGWANRMLEAVEASATSAGADLLVLETGPLQQAAMALYEQHGYAEVAPYGYYATAGLAVSYGKLLTGAEARQRA